MNTFSKFSLKKENKKTEIKENSFLLVKFILHDLLVEIMSPSDAYIWFGLFTWQMFALKRYT
jgi:hypothetical protein